MESTFKLRNGKGTTVLGSGFEGDWKNIGDDFKITELEYTFGDIKITMTGYKQYNHLLECVALGAKGIVKIMLMGRTQDYTDIIGFDLKAKQLFRERKSIGEEYGKQILSGWKEGVLNEPQTKVERIKT